MERQEMALLPPEPEPPRRADLSPAERAAHHARRKELYEEKHPETKKGSAGGRAKNAKGDSAKRQNVDQQSYTTDAAQKTGTTRKTVERDVRRGKDIPNVGDLAGTSLDKGDELDALARLGEMAPETAGSGRSDIAAAYRADALPAGGRRLHMAECACRSTGVRCLRHRDSLADALRRGSGR